MSDTPQLIKEKLDIVDFLRGYLKLSPAGKNFKALCPFHKEKTPSFMISPDRGMWHCFGCSASGDIIKFLMMYENLEFYDALKILAEKAGIELRSISNRDFQAHNNLYKVMEAAKDFFKSNLTTSQVVNGYLKDRGLKPETIEEFELGLAPTGSDALMRHLLKLGFNVADIEKAGLISKTSRGTYWDWFRARLMFPIHNHFGKVVGFTGRIMPPRPEQVERPANPSAGSGLAVAKYVNSPETPVFQKSKILYGFYKTKNDIRQNNSAVVVEGQMDFLMAWQDGVKNIVATSGTALTNEHLSVLRKISDSLVISFDADEAGAAASERAIDLAGAADFNARVLLASGFKDPADLVQKEPGRFKELAASALPAMQYYFYKYINSLKGSQFVDKKRGIRLALSKIAILDSAVEKNHWLKELSDLTGIDEPALSEEMGLVKISNFSAGSAGADAPLEPVNISRKELICQRILGLALNRENFLEQVRPHLEYFPPLYRGASAKLLGSASLQTQQAGENEIDNLVALLNLRSSFDTQNLDEKKIAAEFQELLKQLKKIHLKEKSQKLTENIKSAEARGDDETVTKYQEEQVLVHQEIQKL